MIIVDTALEKREAARRPVRVGLIGAGYIARGIARQLLTPLPGIRLVAIANRTPAKARNIYREFGADSVGDVSSAIRLEAMIDADRPVVTEDAALLCNAGNIDIVVETTGQVEFGARTAMAAIDGGKHTLLVNAELDATIGPILKRKADAAGVVITNTDGDEPGVAMNLVRFVKTIGYRPVMAGNIKGFIDPYRNPDTQRAFAERVKQSADMITSFADGTKLSMECTILGNATGFVPARPGMHGHPCKHVRDVIQHFSAEELLETPLVEYALGAEPGTGAFVVGYNDEPVKKQYMQYFKMGDGPLYVFYTPFHLTHLECAVTIGRAVLFGDAAVAPRGGPVCDVAAVAKRDLREGEVLDGIGGFCCFGRIYDAASSQDQRLLPMGLMRDCRLVRDIPKDTPLTYYDVQCPVDRLCDQLRAEQDAVFFPQAVAV